MSVIIQIERWCKMADWSSNGFWVWQCI